MIKSATGTEFVNAQLLDLKDLIDDYASRIANDDYDIIAIRIYCGTYSDTAYAGIYIYPNYYDYYEGDRWNPPLYYFFGKTEPGYVYITQYNGSYYVAHEEAYIIPGYGATSSDGLSGGYGGHAFQTEQTAGVASVFYPCQAVNFYVPESKINPNRHALSEAKIIV